MTCPPKEVQKVLQQDKAFTKMFRGLVLSSKDYKTTKSNALNLILLLEEPS
jgi:hypothetical protein